MLPNTPQMQNAAGGRRSAEAQTIGRGLHGEYTSSRFHAQVATAQPLLAKLDGVQQSGTGWRARCPACGGSSRKLSIAESGDRVLVHCFGCGDADAVLGAVGLGWKDLHPPRGWPQSADEQRQARRAIRQTGWESALSVLALEAKIVLFAARELHFTGGLEVEDGKRLAQAVKRIGDAASVLTEAERFKPGVRA